MQVEKYETKLADRKRVHVVPPPLSRCVHLTISRGVMASPSTPPLSDEGLGKRGGWVQARRRDTETLFCLNRI